MKKKKYLPLYEKWMQTGRLPEMGLCNSLPKGALEFIEPQKFLGYGYSVYWAYGKKVTKMVYTVDDDEAGLFSPLRQTIVLFLAAMNDEL